MDISTATPNKEMWFIIYFKEGDPDQQFEIVEESRIIRSPQTVLEKGTYISIRFGNCKCLGALVESSDDFNHLKQHFDEIKSKFLAEHSDNHEPDSTSVINDSKNVEKANKGTQTDPDRELTELQTENNKLEKLCSTLEAKRDKLRRNVNAAINNRFKPKKRRSSIPSPIHAKRKEAKFKPVPRKIKRERKELSTTEDETEDSDDDGYVTIGSNKTKIPKAVHKSINWRSYTAAARKLLMCLFDRQTLATHSLTGKPSPAFANAKKPPKMRLDPKIIADIVEIVSEKCGVSASIVRTAITTKCADENKMMRKRMQSGKENADPAMVGIKKELETNK